MRDVVSIAASPRLSQCLDNLGTVGARVGRVGEAIGRGTAVEMGDRCEMSINVVSVAAVQAIAALDGVQAAQAVGGKLRGLAAPVGQTEEAAARGISVA